MKKYLVILLLFIALFVKCNDNKQDNPIIPRLPAGNFWEQTAEIDMGIKTLAIDTDDYLLAGTDRGWIYRSIDNGNNWIRINSGVLELIQSLSYIEVNSKGDIFVVASGGHIFRTMDNGGDWAEVSPHTLLFRALIIDLNDDLFGITYGGTYRSTDNGDSWFKTSDDLANNHLYILAINTDSYIFVAGEGGIYRSKDNGNTWIKTHDNRIRSLTIDQNTGDIFAIEFYGNALYRSTNNGDSWIKIGVVNVSSLVINSIGKIFGITGSEGVAYSNDYGKNWIQINKGLTYPFVQCLAINSEDYIFAGTVQIEDFPTPNKGEVFKSRKPTTSE